MQRLRGRTDYRPILSFIHTITISTMLNNNAAFLNNGLKNTTCKNFFNFLHRFSKSQIYTNKNVFERGGDAVVPAAGRVTRFHGVLHPNRHVGRRLYILRDGLR